MTPGPSGAVGATPVGGASERSIWFHLALLCAGIAIPSLVFSAVLLWQVARAEVARVEDDAARAAVAVASAVERDLAILAASLGALSHANSLRRGDLGAFHEAASRVAAELELAVVLFDRDGRQLVNTRRPFGQDLPGVHPVVAEAIPRLAQGPVVTDAFVGQIADQLLYVLMIPVAIEPGAPWRYGLQFSIPAARLGDMVERALAPSLGVVLLADAAGRTVARSRAIEDYVGRVSETLRNARVAADGRTHSVSAEGEPVLVFTAPLAAAGWTAVVAVEERVLRAPARRVVGLLAALGAALAAVAALGAALFGRRIVRALDHLVESAGAITSGASSVEIETPIAEVNRAGRAHVAAARELREALLGKEALLYEVNHRVKNSLAVVASLLAMHARRARGEPAAEILEAARARVDAIATLHRRLYQDGRHDSVALLPFLDEVCSDTLAALDPERRIVFRSEGDPRLVAPVDLATPVGVLVSELVVNAAKHAFPERGGAVRLELAAEGATARIVVEDDGVGLPDGFDPAASAGVGMRVVQALVRQIRGRLEIERRAAGARMTAHFSLER